MNKILITAEKTSSSLTYCLPVEKNNSSINVIVVSKNSLYFIIFCQIKSWIINLLSKNKTYYLNAWSISILKSEDENSLEKIAKVYASKVKEILSKTKENMTSEHLKSFLYKVSAQFYNINVDFSFITKKENINELDDFIKTFGVNLKDEHGYTLLHHAIMNNNNTAINEITSYEELDIDYQINDKTYLHFAIEKENTSVLKRLIEKKININPHISYVYAVENSPFQLTICYRFKEGFEILLNEMKKNIKDLDEKNKYVKTAFNYAIKIKNFEAVKFLLDEFPNLKKDLDEKNKYVKTTFNDAIKIQNFEAVKFLLDEFPNLKKELKFLDFINILKKSEGYKGLKKLFKSYLNTENDSSSSTMGFVPAF